MSKNAPDYSSTFKLAGNDLVQDQLEDARNRLAQRRAENESSAGPPIANKDLESHNGLVIKSDSIVRKAMTLKVLESNELKFNQLFCKLQLGGDIRKKQDLADEALELLFSKYRAFLDESVEKA